MPTGNHRFLDNLITLCRKTAAAKCVCSVNTVLVQCHVRLQVAIRAVSAA